MEWLHGCSALAVGSVWGLCEGGVQKGLLIWCFPMKTTLLRSAARWRWPCTRARGFGFGRTWRCMPADALLRRGSDSPTPIPRGGIGHARGVEPPIRLGWGGQKETHNLVVRAHEFERRFSFQKAAFLHSIKGGSPEHRFIWAAFLLCVAPWFP